MRKYLLLETDKYISIILKDDEEKDNSTTTKEKRSKSELRFNEKNSVVDKKTFSQLKKF
jgi:hypothetical protein